MEWSSLGDDGFKGDLHLYFAGKTVKGQRKFNFFSLTDLR